jgi:hypothetical protein
LKYVKRKTEQLKTITTDKRIIEKEAVEEEPITAFGPGPLLKYCGLI